MLRKGTGSLTILCLLLCASFYCQVGYSSDPSVVDALPGLGQTLVIDSDSIFNIAEDEMIVSAGELVVNGTDGAIEFEIINNGDLTFNNNITCNAANLTIINNGDLVFQDLIIMLTGNSTLRVESEDDFTLSDVNIQVYGGYMYIVSDGALDAHNLYIKDQFDGTWITNYGDASFSESTFVANGAMGQINLYSSGNLQMHHAAFDANYGGTLNLNAAMGDLNVTDSTLDVSGASHGKYSNLNILAEKATWENCKFINNAARINYLSSEELYLYNCSITNAGTGPATVLSNFGSWDFNEGSISGSGSISISCSENSKLSDCTFYSSDLLTLINYDALSAENWQLKTTASGANISLFNEENGKLTFNKSFIEDVSAETLLAIGPAGQQFTETSGGTITVTNKGTIQKKSNPEPTPEPTAQPSQTSQTSSQATPKSTQTPHTTPTPAQTPQKSPAPTQTMQSSQNPLECGNSDTTFTGIFAIVLAIIVVIVIMVCILKKRESEKQKTK